MVLILGRRLNREDLGVRDSPATKRKVFEMDPKSLTGHEFFDFSSGSSHAENILQIFNEFRDNRLFTDVIICVEGKEFPCHRAVLSACSSYFRAMFCNDHRESREMLVEINGILAEAMECFLQYVYTGKVKITTENVQYIFETSSLFQISVLRDACAKFLEEQLDPCNCLGIQRFADTHSLKTLFTKCKTFALQTFEDVSQHEEFLELDKDELIDYICSDELVITKEEMVFEAVMRWVYRAVDLRRPLLHELLTHVRLPLLHPNYFVQTVEVDQLIQNSPECYQLLHEARRYHILGNEMMSPRTRPRRSTGYSEVIVVVGGCERVGGFNLPYTECYDPVTGEWKSLAKLPEFTKSEYAVCALRNDILVSGGRINGRDVWIYNSQLNIWIRVASLNKGRWRHKMAVLLGKVQSYDPETNSWLLRAAIPIAKRCITAVSLNNLIYVAGGLTKAIYCYDPVEDYWMHVQNTFSRQENCGMSVCNGKIYILGGRRENGEATDTILCYDPATSIITGVAAMPRPVSYHGCVTIHRYNEKCFKL
ncbi:kelch-like protein 24 isoform X3 [Myotis lucifugus]|uniref:kelch-like protein 24 isoform X3 n=1 Tax=Myotis lucifugus TaxID=59463 RepID=UPI000CCC3428|nr:kelch-like protein 24 isoform X3 [Myotis lucifugus]